MNKKPTPQVLRPRDLALLLLASRDLMPRQRARDQRADVAGLELKRRVLKRLADVDPEPVEAEITLMRIIEELGPPHGPTRAIATAIHEEWQAACLNPQWVSHLLAEAVGQEEKPRMKHGSNTEGGRV